MEENSERTKPGTFSCQLCRDRFDDQFSFFEHLRQHYEKQDQQQNDTSQSTSRITSEVVVVQGSENQPALVRESSPDCVQPIVSVDAESGNEHDYGVQSSAFEISTIPNPERTSRRQKASEASITDTDSEKNSSKIQEKIVTRRKKSKQENLPANNENAIVITIRADENQEEIGQDELHDVRLMVPEVEGYSSADEVENEQVSSRKKKKVGRGRGDVLKCPHCDRVFNHRNSLIYHLRSHTGERPHQCDMCGKRFFATSALKVHMRLHSGEKPFGCPHCDKYFRQWGDLTYHKISIHSNVRQHQCEFCGKDFARKYSLVVHRRIHTGEKNYKCEYCHKSFRASSYLQNHRRIHTGEKPHTCVVCSKPFRVRSDMKRHMGSHTREQLAATTASTPTRCQGKPEVSKDPKGSQTISYDEQNLNSEATEVVLPAEAPTLITFTQDDLTSAQASVKDGLTTATEYGGAQTDVFNPNRTRPVETVALGSSGGTIYVWPVFMS